MSATIQGLESVSFLDEGTGAGPRVRTPPVLWVGAGWLGGFAGCCFCMTDADPSSRALLLSADEFDTIVRKPNDLAESSNCSWRRAIEKKRKKKRRDSTRRGGWCDSFALRAETDNDRRRTHQHRQPRNLHLPTPTPTTATYVGRAPPWMTPVPGDCPTSALGGQQQGGRLPSR
jgi:hypothetical protein